MLVLSRKAGESVMIDGNIEVKVIEVSGDVVKVGIEAPQHIRVHRREVYLSIEEENRRAAHTHIDLQALRRFKK